MKKIFMATALCALLTVPVVALAEGYIGIAGGQNKMDVSGVKESTAFSAFGGYSFNEYIGAELAYVDFGSADTNVPGISMKGNAVSLDAVGSLPLGNDFSLFAKLGYASTHIEISGGTSSNKADVTYGIGAQYKASKNWAVRLGYDNYRVGENNTKDSAYTNLGVLFMF